MLDLVCSYHGGPTVNRHDYLLCSVVIPLRVLVLLANRDKPNCSIVNILTAAAGEEKSKLENKLKEATLVEYKLD